MNNINSRKKGFTLIELLTSGGIVVTLAATLALTGGVVYGGYKGVQALNKYINRPEVQRANVIGNERAELFMERDGKRFYSEIDGKSVEDTVTNQK